MAWSLHAQTGVAPPGPAVQSHPTPNTACRDGSEMVLTPETSVRAQKALGADIILPLDELPPYHIAAADLEASLDRSHRWEARSLACHLSDRRRQAMYGIIHGGMSLDYRRRSVDYLSALPFDGFAVGGSMGKNRCAGLARQSC